MKKIFRDIISTVFILLACFLLCLLIHRTMKTDSLIPMIFVLGTFLISTMTEGYLYGVISAFAGVLAFHFAFTLPFFRFDFMAPENLISAVILIVVSLLTCTMTTQLKRQKAIQAESENERMRANLLRAVSHDLRTPLTTIYGSSSAMLENEQEFSPEQKRKMLTGIREDAQWLNRMVENLLSITKLNSENVKIQKSPVVLEELIDSVLVKFHKRYPEQEISLHLPEELVIIPMDGILIQQVIINLLENAVQHAIGMTELDLTVSVTDTEAVFSVTDNGCGIDENKRKHIFSGYYPSDNTPADRMKTNAGIGLSVCATIIKAHGGQISAENRKEGGAIFRFTLELEEINHA